MLYMYDAREHCSGVSSRLQMSTPFLSRKKVHISLLAEALFLVFADGEKRDLCHGSKEALI